jgi:hypothetical protein
MDLGVLSVGPPEPLKGSFSFLASDENRGVAPHASKISEWSPLSVEWFGVLVIEDEYMDRDLRSLANDKDAASSPGS